MLSTALASMLLTALMTADAKDDQPKSVDAAIPTTRRIAQPIPVRKVDDSPGSGGDKPRTHRQLEQSRLGPDGNQYRIAGRPDPLVPMDAGIADLNALSSSLRVMQPDTTPSPVAFSKVYRVPGDPNHLMRGNGALFAIFPYSEYRTVKKRGRVPILPAATIFRIGSPAQYPLGPIPDSFADAPSGRTDGRVERRNFDGHSDAGSARVDGRINLYRGDVGAAVPPQIAAKASNVTLSASEETGPLTTTLPRFVTDEEYRRVFFETLRIERRK